MKGTVTALFFDPEGYLTTKIQLSESGSRLIQVPINVYHSFIVEEISAYLEIRNCPYDRNIDRVYASLAPEEESAAADQYNQMMFSLGLGEKIVLFLKGFLCYWTKSLSTFRLQFFGKL